MRFSDYEAQGTDGRPHSPTARFSRGTPLGTGHTSGTQWQSYSDPTSRPCLTARPAPSPGPHGGLRILCSRGRSRGRQPADTEITPLDCPSSADPSPPRPTTHYPPLARSHRDGRGHGGHDPCQGETTTSRTVLLGATDSSPVSAEARGCRPTHPSFVTWEDGSADLPVQAPAARENPEGMNTTASVPALLTQRGHHCACAATAACGEAHAHPGACAPLSMRTDLGSRFAG